MPLKKQLEFLANTVSPSSKRAIRYLLGFDMLFLRKAASDAVGPGYCSTSFFLNSAGFLFWLGKIFKNRKQ